VWTLLNPPWKEEIAGLQLRLCNPGFNGHARRVRHLELNASLGLLLHHDGARSHMLPV
jgi:hypothetical protein